MAADENAPASPGVFVDLVDLERRGTVAEPVREPRIR
jgi:hypothetical protein